MTMHKLSTTIFAALLALPVFAQQSMPVARQNTLVEKYCAVCHSDAVKNGGLSLQRFDAATASPTLIAMMLSKLGTGALGASGQPVPDMKATDDALKAAFTQAAKTAMEWSVERGPVLTASIFREAAPAKADAPPEDFRLILTCEVATKKGSVQLAWSPLPQSGSLNASVDGGPAVRYPVEGSEAMGNGSGVKVQGRAEIALSPLLPKQSLTIRDLYPNEAVTFPFATLPAAARRELAACFPVV